MRTITTLQRNAISATTINVYHKLEVTGPDDVPTGTRQWFDVSSNLPSTAIDFLNTATLAEDIDGNCMTLNAVLLRESGTASLAPLMTGSLVNRNNASTYAPILEAGRQWRLSVAIPTTVGVAPVSGDWKVMGVGYIDSIDTGSSASTITIIGRDLGAKIIDAFISNNVTIYSPLNNQSLEQVVQSLLDNTLGSGVVTLYTPVATSIVMPSFQQDYGGLMEAITSLAAKFGFIVRYYFDSSDNFQLTLMKPNRAPTTPAWVTGAGEYLEVPQNLVDISGVRNYIELRYIDASTGALTTVVSPSGGTSSSITKYGKRYMAIDQQNGSQINNATSAQGMADAVRSDLEIPSLQQQIVSYGLWFVQLYDYAQFTANGVHYDADQYGGVKNISHTISGGTLKTTVGASGKPAGRYRVYGALGVDFAPGLDFPNLGVTIKPYADHYLITFSGAGVTYSVDGAGYIPSPASPWSLSRDAATHQYSLQIVRPTGTITDTFTLPSLGADMVTPNITVTPGTMSSTTQQYVPTCSNPAADGRTLGLTITLHGGLTATGSTTGAITTNDSPIAIVSGETITITRATFGSNPCNVTFGASLTGGGIQSVQRTVPNQDKTTFGPSLTLSVTPGPSSYSIAYSAGGTSYVLAYTVDGGAHWNTPGASPITITRGASDIVATFRNVADGQTVTDSVTVPALGSTAVTTPDLQVVPGTMTTTTAPFVVTCVDPSGLNTPVITVTIRNGLGGTAGTGPGGSMTDGVGYTMATGSTVTVSRSPFASGPCSITFRGVLPAGGAAEIQRTVVNQDKLSFGPNLVVTPTPGATSYSIAWSGDGVLVSINGAAAGTPGSSPISVTRNAPGGADITYAFQGVKDGQTTSNTVVIPAQSGSTTPSASLIPVLTNNQVDDTTSPVNVVATATNLPASYTWVLSKGFSKGQYSGTFASGSNSSNPLSGAGYSFNVNPNVKNSQWFRLRVTVGSDNYDAETQIQGLMAFIDPSTGRSSTTAQDSRGALLNNDFRMGTDTAANVVPTVSAAFINPTFIDGSNNPVSVYRSSSVTPTTNLALISSSSIYPSQFVAGYVDVVLSFRNGSSTPTGQFAGKQSDTSYTGAGLWIREAGFAGGTGSTRPSLGFHWSGVVASQITLALDGSLQMTNGAGSGYADLYAQVGHFAANVITSGDFVGNHIIKLGQGVSGYGGQVQVVDDSNTLRWAFGLLGSASYRDFAIYDAVSAVTRLTIDHTNGQAQFATSSGSDIALIGAASQGTQIQLGSSSVVSAVGTTYSNGWGYLTYNAIQTAKGTDNWLQNYSGIASTMLAMQAGGLSLYAAASSHAAGTQSAFWGTAVASISNTGAAFFGGGLVTTASLASDYIARFRQTSASGYGVYIWPGSDTLDALRISNAAGTANPISLYGNGNASIYGHVGVGQAFNTSYALAINGDTAISIYMLGYDNEVFSALGRTDIPHYGIRWNQLSYSGGNVAMMLGGYGGVSIFAGGAECMRIISGASTITGTLGVSGNQTAADFVLA